MMEKNLLKNLSYKNKYLFFSVNSQCLKYFKENIISIPVENKEFDNSAGDHFSYMIILGKNLIKLSTFEKSGYFNEKYDITFAFGMNYILNQEYFIFNGNGLMADAINEIDNLMKKIIRRKGKFEYGNDILLEIIELNMASGIIYYTKDAKKNIKDAGINKKIIQFDLIKERQAAFDSFKEFDTKIINGTLKEFDWNKNEVVLQGNLK